MNFKKGAVALCVSSVLLATNAMVVSADETKAAYAEQAKTSHYTIYLTQNSALKKHPVGKHDYKDELASIDATQNALFATIQARFPEAKLLSQGRLLANFITIELQANKQAELSKFVSVANVTETKLSAAIEKNNIKHYVTATTAVKSAMQEPALMTPYTGDSMAGDGAKVAIISSGIDYTLALFGGSGEYGDDSNPDEPPAENSYLDAVAHRSIEYTGFPTDVVAGGWDFASDNYGEDPNPIEPNVVGQDWRGDVYDTGLGTELASIVHQLAPGAKLYAYKISNISDDGSGDAIQPIQWASSAKVISALEHAIDPNQDGDTSDHLDVALIDAVGSSAFIDLNAAAGPSLIQYMIEVASNHGLTIVTHSGLAGQYYSYGEAEAKVRNNISHEGGSTSAITVGSVLTTNVEGTDVTKIADYSPKGTVSGTMALKPEIVTHADEQTVAKISNLTDDAKLGVRGGAQVASARIAAAIAVLKAAHPGLGPVELKALLANTANSQGILETDGEEAEIISKGHGIEDVDAALQTPVVVWDKANVQPYLQFGAHEVMEQLTLVRHLTVRNLSDSAQTYNLAFNTDGEKSGFEALMVELPETVSIPAHGSVDLPVSIMVDGNKLPEWPTVGTASHTEANLSATELSGYITLTAEGKPELNLGWMLKARPATTIDKDPESVTYPNYLGFNPETGMSDYEHIEWAKDKFGTNEWGDYAYTAINASFVNTSKTATTFEAYPVWIHKPHLPEGKENTAGNFIRAVGGGMYDEPMCSSGKKVSIAVSFHQPADVSNAKYFDKIGAALFYYDLVPEWVVKGNEWDQGFDGIQKVWVEEKDEINQPFVSVNSKGQPVTYFINKNIPYNPSNHSGRYTPSQLDTRFTNNGKNIVSELCVDELYHNDWDEVADYDQNLGFHIETDRDAGKEKGEPMHMVNLTKGGYYAVEEVCAPDWFGNIMCSEQTVDETMHISLNKLEEGDDVKTVELQHSITTEPGDEVEITVASIVQFTLDGGSPPKPFMVMSSNDDFFQIGYDSNVDKDGSAIVDVTDGQVFSLDENVEAGTVVGVIDVDSEGFFATGGTDWAALTIEFVDAVIGSPFTINQETRELIVANPFAIDFESTPTFVLTAVSKQGNSIGNPGTITVNLNDVNDIAPAVNADVLASKNNQEVYLKHEQSSVFTLDIADIITDREGNGLTYTVSSDDITELNIAGTMVTGTVSTLGEASFTLMASDGAHQTSTDISVNVMEQNEAPLGTSPVSIEVQINSDDVAEVSIDVTDLFADVNQDSLSYSVIGNGILSLSETNLVGSFTEVGDYSYVVTATDGEYSAQTVVNISVLEKESSDGGAMGWLTLMLAGLLFRRKQS